MFLNRFHVIHGARKRDVTDNVEDVSANLAVKVRMRSCAGVKSFPPGVNVKLLDLPRLSELG